MTNQPYVMSVVCCLTTWPRQWRAASWHPGLITAMLCCTVRPPPPSTFCNGLRTSWPESSVSTQVEPTINHFSGRSTGCQWSNESPTKWRRWHSRCFHHRRQYTCTTWSGQLFLFGLCDLPTLAAVFCKNTNWICTSGILSRSSTHLELTAVWH